ncbi:MAG: peptide chain release factor N(5)-glutamine methyltransferase [Paludibacteraceae bacterium]|nr:peptide chain release factor N(5)-glutamine methyltransferase [Paludibacteraceae bacterium]
MGYAFFIDMGQEITPYIKRLLMSHITGLSTVQLLAEPNLQLTEEQQTWFDEAIVRLQNNEPIQHILGYSEFYGRKFKCDRRALVPRPETEELVDWIISMHNAQCTILDIGTGTGCIALSLAKELPLAKVTALDISIDALSLAHENAEMLEVGNVDFTEGDILNMDNEHCVAREKYAVIVSNPPYVRECEKAKMEANVLEYDPHIALFVSNEDPLIFYRAIGEFGLSHLEKDGALYFEINQYLSQETCDLLIAMGYKNVELREDINGNARMIKATL